MPQMLLLADDLTGALDTGVQFAKSKVSVFVATTDSINESLLADVLVVNTESRHLTAQEAYRKVYKWVERTGKQTLLIYKKTDSLLRGNIGAELAAALEASGRNTLVFIPSFPRMGRVVKDGLIYVNGRLLTETRDSEDVFDPVKLSEVDAIVSSQTDIPVRIMNLANETFVPSERREIVISNAVSEEEMRVIASNIRSFASDIVLAGCAGFAEYMDGYIIPRETIAPSIFIQKARYHLILCGSINERTRKQITYAIENRIPQLYLDAPEYLEGLSPNMEEKICTMMKKHGAVLLYTARTENDIMESYTYAKTHQIPENELKYCISKGLGAIAKCVMRKIEIDALSVIGGDTLAGVLTALGCQGIIPLSELNEGIVQSVWIQENSQYRTLQTKAGSFGGDKAIWRMYESLSKK